MYKALTVLWCIVIIGCAHPVKENDAIKAFINQMVVEHQFDKHDLTQVFEKVEIKPDIIKKISKPSESLPWYKYRKIFLTEARIKAGVKFWHENAQALTFAEREFGVPAELIVAIIGVETQYGKYPGRYKVIDALSTLAFFYPPRSLFFLSELEQFLLLCKESHIDPLVPTGSYAGAMGMPQFMPSSYRNYAIDFNNDNYINIWNNPDDVIVSIANYFAKHGWQSHDQVTFQICDSSHKSVINSYLLKDDLSLIKCNDPNPKMSKPLLSTKKAKIVAFEQENGEEIWAALENFHVITRYNKSPLYAMAVYQLSLGIANQRDPSYEKIHPDTSATGLERLRRQ